MPAYHLPSAPSGVLVCQCTTCQPEVKSRCSQNQQRTLCSLSWWLPEPMKLSNLIFVIVTKSLRDERSITSLHPSWRPLNQKKPAVGPPSWVLDLVKSDFPLHLPEVHKPWHTPNCREGTLLVPPSQVECGGKEHNTQSETPPPTNALLRDVPKNLVMCFYWKQSVRHLLIRGSPLLLIRGRPIPRW